MPQPCAAGSSRAGARGWPCRRAHAALASRLWRRGSDLVTHRQHAARLLRGLAHLSRYCEDATRHGRSCRGVEP